MSNNHNDWDQEAKSQKPSFKDVRKRVVVDYKFDKKDSATIGF